MMQDVLPASARLRRFLALSALLYLAVNASGCGGGSQQNSPPVPDFTLKENPATVSIPGGGSATTSLSVTALNGFTGKVNVQFSGLPAGVSASPTTITLASDTSQTITILASWGMAATKATVTITGSSGALSHSVNLSVSVTAGGSSPSATRTKYVRSDAATEYFTWLNTHWINYHQATARFFVTDPNSNHISVFDAASEKQIGSIIVPGAFGIDDTPDHSILYVGTLIGDIYAIDPVAMKVTRRYLASQIGPYGGYLAFSALVLADGRLALLGAQGGIPSVDGSSSIAIWNPADNSLAIYGAPTGVGVPASPLCSGMGNIGGFARTPDRTAVLLGSIDSDGTLCEINPSTSQYLSIALGGFSTSKIISSPDGNYIAFPIYPNQVVLYDVKTLNKVAQFSVNGSAASDSDLVFSADSKTLFVPSSSIVYAYDVTTHQQIGWLPNIVVQNTSGGYTVGPASNPDYEVMDGTGLLVGPLEEGLGFLDTTQLRTGPVGTNFLNGYLDPATGPTSGGTVTRWTAPATVNAQSGIYFGNNPVSSVSTSTSGYITVTAPPGNPGPVDVYVFTGDGGMQLIPEGFSYGPAILQVTPDNSSEQGGGVGVVYGYGFGPSSATKVPADLSVTVGGKFATIVGFSPLAYYNSAPPFLLQSVSYTIPPGVAGTSIDVSVTTSSGTATAPASLTYLPALKQFPLPGSALVQGIYDPIRDVYYFTDANQIQVFSLAQEKWLSPIPIAGPAGATQRLWGIALSPDGSKLAVADAGAGVVYLVDPANPASVKTFPIVPSFPGGILALPCGVAITDAGIVYVVIDVQGGTGFHNYFKLDTNSGTLTDLQLSGPGMGASDLYLRTTLSADNARVYFNNLGYVFSLDTATDRMFPATTGPSCCYGDYDLTLSKNQTQVEATSYLFDSDLNAKAFYTLNDREILNVLYVYGTKLSPDGGLLFQPASSGMDVYDGRLGTLRARIALPVALSPNYDALVSDGKDNVLLAITGKNGDGIAVLDLSSLSEPAPLSYAAALSSQSGRVMRPVVGAAGVQLNRSATRKTNAPLSGPRVIPRITNPALLKALP